MGKRLLQCLHLSFFFLFFYVFVRFGQVMILLHIYAYKIKFMKNSYISIARLRRLLLDLVEKGRLAIHDKIILTMNDSDWIKIGRNCLLYIYFPFEKRFLVNNINNSKSWIVDHTIFVVRALCWHWEIQILQWLTLTTNFSFDPVMSHQIGKILCRSPRYPNLSHSQKPSECLMAAWYCLFPKSIRGS